MVDKFTILLSVHVLAAALWVGVGLAVNVAMTLAARSGEPANMLAGLRFSKALGTYFFPWIALVVFASGAWLVEDYFGWDLLWVQIGMAGVIVATAIGVLYLKPRAAAGIEAIERGDPPPPGRNWVPIVARINFLLVSTVLVLMVIRPD
jgi:uncharacterized membrane protein